MAGRVQDFLQGCAVDGVANRGLHPPVRQIGLRAAIGNLSDGGHIQAIDSAGTDKEARRRHTLADVGIQLGQQELERDRLFA